MDRLRGGSVIVVSPSCGGRTTDSEDRETGRVMSGAFNGMFFNGGESGQKRFFLDG